MIKKYPSKKAMCVSELGEFGLIKSFRTKCARTSSEVLKGIGDDTAVIKMPAGKMLITSDMIIEGVHFSLPLTGFYQLGYKILAVNISDIFAMGGTPRYFLLSLGIPGTYDSCDIKELYSGLMKLSKRYGITTVGGDTCSSKYGLVLSGTLVGSAEKTITRSGARCGDGIFVTDTLGDSAMGLEILRKLGKKIPIKMQNEKCKMKNANLKILGTNLTFKETFPLLKRHLMPEPRPLEDTTGVTSMIDISDGLLMDLSHICDESRVGALIYKHRLPLSRELIIASRGLGADPFNFALRGGEDYALLFTAPANIKTNPAPPLLSCESKKRGCRANAFKIGEITRKGRFLVDARGRKTPFKAEGYEHFK